MTLTRNKTQWLCNQWPLYTPPVLDPIPVSPHTHGVPGGRLRRAKLPAHRKAAGVAGEQRFGKALTLTGVTGKAEVFFSVPMPDPTRTKFGNVQRARDMRTDIDCIITTGHLMVLVDVKMFRAAQYYTTHDGQLIGVDAAGAVVSKHKMTRNMMVGAERFQGLFPHMLVIPAVVLMPATVLKIRCAPGACYPGGVKIYPPHRFFPHLLDLLEKVHGPPVPGVMGDLARLTGKRP